VRYAEASDRERVLGLVSDTGFFRSDELEIAAEVFDDAVRSGSGGHYQSFVAEYCDEVVGWVCYGPTPCTVGTFDIYWIAVTQELQGMGFGRILMEYAESEISRRGGRLSVVETSGHERYASTQRFYLAMGYHEASRIQDFYDTGDDRVVYIKSLKA
jgi:ribosomal protein S18 acetylase RimI-like enzyme